MIRDAKQRRSFSNIVAEYTKEFDSEHPLKIIGGQHRFEAIRAALPDGIDEYHGVKVYLGLDMTQRLDVQLISNTNIAISGDLFDRLQETFQGPELRDWCQAVGLLQGEEDFADSYEKGGPISVKMARTFITNYFKGTTVDAKQFDLTPYNARGLPNWWTGCHLEESRPTSQNSGATPNSCKQARIRGSRNSPKKRIQE